MKVCHLINSYPLPTGGMQSYCYNLAYELSKHGHEIHVYVSGIVSQSACNKGFEVKRFKPIFNLGKATFSPSLILSLLKERFDLVHVHLPFPFGFEIALVITKLRKIPIVATYQCSIESYRGNLFKKFFFESYNYVNRHLLNYLDKIIFSTSDYLKSTKVSNLKTSIIPIGVDLNRFKPLNKESTRKRLGLPISKFIVLFVGNMDTHNYYKKGVGYLLNAAQLIKRRLPNIYISLIGKRDENIARITNNVCKKQNLHDVVKFFGVVSDKNLPLYYAASDILILPSVSKLEAFGIVLLEAMASGLPVIGSDIPGVRSVIKSSEAGFLVKPKSSQDIVRKIARVSRLKNLDKIARKSAEENYDWEIIVKQIERVYLQIIKQKS